MHKEKGAQGNPCAPNSVYACGEDYIFLAASEAATAASEAAAAASVAATAASAAASVAATAASVPAATAASVAATAASLAASEASIAASVASAAASSAGFSEQAARAKAAPAAAARMILRMYLILEQRVDHARHKAVRKANLFGRLGCQLLPLARRCKRYSHPLPHFGQNWGTFR